MTYDGEGRHVVLSESCDQNKSLERSEGLYGGTGEEGTNEIAHRQKSAMTVCGQKSQQELSWRQEVCDGGINGGNRQGVKIWIYVNERWMYGNKIGPNLNKSLYESGAEEWTFECVCPTLMCSEPYSPITLFYLIFSRCRPGRWKTETHLGVSDWQPLISKGSHGLAFLSEATFGRPFPTPMTLN